MLQMVAGRKYSAKTSCFTAVIFDPVTEIMSSLPRCNHHMVQMHNAQASQGCYNTPLPQRFGPQIGEKGMYCANCLCFGNQQMRIICQFVEHMLHLGVNHVASPHN